MARILVDVSLLIIGYFWALDPKISLSSLKVPTTELDLVPVGTVRHTEKKVDPRLYPYSSAPAARLLTGD